MNLDATLTKLKAEAVIRRCSVKKMFLEISQNWQEITCARISFLIKFQVSVCNFIKKETLAQVFSCGFCEISNNAFSYRTPPMAPSSKGWENEAANPLAMLPHDFYEISSCIIFSKLLCIIVATFGHMISFM